MKDYFQEAMDLIWHDDATLTIEVLIREDLANYRMYNINQYNGDIERATDEHCFRKFLNEYKIAVNVFSLHSHYASIKTLNRYIESFWQVIVYEKDKWMEED